MKRPDENTLKLWLEGMLEGEELLSIEKWAESNVGDLDAEFKCQIGWDALSDEMMAKVPESLEPPYPEFFNSRIEHATSEGMEDADEAGTSTTLWQKLRLILAPAFIAAIVAFYAGLQMQSQKQDLNADVKPDVKPELIADVKPDLVADVDPDILAKIAAKQNSVYVPNSGIMAAVSESETATEIILDGLAPISDELDIAAGETSRGRSPMMANAKDEESPRIFF